MCYVVYMATDCADDLSGRSSDLVRFEKPTVEAGSAWPSVLSSEHRWVIGSKSQCSCTFRHLHRDSVDLGFGAPVDWFPEEQDALDATQQLYHILQDLVERGHEVELLDCWEGDDGKAPVRLEVSLEQLSAEQFRLFEGHMFTFGPRVREL